MFAKLLLVHELTEFLENVKSQHVDIVYWAFDVILDSVYLFPHLKLLISLI